jgi:hypothetical protein
MVEPSISPLIEKKKKEKEKRKRVKPGMLVCVCNHSTGKTESK